MAGGVKMAEKSCYGIHELSKLAGVSARTLRYYDEIGLLKPSFSNEAGYRFYGSREVDLLQQILFYRERGVRLEQIREILYCADFDTMGALKEHLRELQSRQKRLEHLIAAVKQTMEAMKGERTMSDREKFAAFQKKAVQENETKYGAEIREKYGDAQVDMANEKWLHLTQEEYAKFQELEKEIKEALQAAVREGLSPEDARAEQIVAMHKEWLGFTWNFYSKEAHQGLAEMYVADDRFRAYYDGEVPGCAAFLKEAILIWAK